MSEAKTIPAKYIFLDVVSFSHNRSVEAQTDIVHSLNDIVKRAIFDNNVSEENLILLPTGDGICIAILNIEDPFDIHMRIALDILRKLEEYNKVINDEMRKFNVRIGINANTDNLVIDINENQNIAGYGINMAQRIMSKADGSQILVGQSVFDILHARESYMRFFRSFPTTVKHGEPIQIYQFVDESRVGLDTNIPEAFREAENTEPKLSLHVACYFAHAITKREFFLQRKEGLFAIKIILLWMLAGDSVGEIEAKGLTSYPQRTYKARDANFIEQFEYYSQIHDGLAWEISQLIIYGHLFKHYSCFDDFNMWFISQKGKEKLKQDWPDIWVKFDLDNV